MNYYNNGPYLKSLEKTSSSKTSSGTIILISALVIMSGFSYYQAIKLQTQNNHIAQLQEQLRNNNQPGEELS